MDENIEQIVVPLQPKYCRKCNVMKRKMDFSKVSHICTECTRKSKKARELQTDYSNKKRWNETLWFKAKRNVDYL